MSHQRVTSLAGSTNDLQAALSNWQAFMHHDRMNELIRYRGYRYPPEVISYAVWLCYRFTLSFRDIEDLLAERGVMVSYESIRLWCHKFGPAYARRLRKGAGSEVSPQIQLCYQPVK